MQEMIYDHYMKKHIITRMALVPLVGLAFFTEAMGAAPSHKKAAKVEKVQDNNLTYAFEDADVALAVKNIRALSPLCRAAFIGMRWGLFFRFDGGEAYYNNERFHEKEHVHFYEVTGDAQMVDFEGNVHRFYNVIRRNLVEEGHRDAWVEATGCIGRTSDEAVFAAFREDIVKLAQVAAAYHMKQLPEELRTAWLVQQACLLSIPEGKSFFTGEVQRKRIPGTHIEMVSRGMFGNPQYKDADGKVHSFNDEFKKMTPQQRATWEYASYCAAIVGAKNILGAFAQEVKALRKANVK